MVVGIFSAFGKPARILHLPQWFFILLVKLRPGSDINSEMIRRQGADLVFDDRQARELLAYKPTAIPACTKRFQIAGVGFVTGIFPGLYFFVFHPVWVQCIITQAALQILFVL